jgi:hypothetical protein
MEKSEIKNALIKLYTTYYNENEKLINLTHSETFDENDDNIFYGTFGKLDVLHHILYDLDQIIRNY